MSIPFVTGEKPQKNDANSWDMWEEGGSGITSTVSVQKLANEAKIALNIKEFAAGDELTDAQFTLLPDGNPVIEFNKDMFSVDTIAAIESATKKWNLDNTIPYSAADILAGINGYNHLKDYVTVHELGHYYMYKYCKEHEYVEGKTSDMYCMGTTSWKEIVSKCLKSGWKAPTYYSKNNYGELFAECWTLHKYGHDDLIHKDIIDFIEIVKKEGDADEG